MPTYINPKFVHVEPRGGFPVGAVVVLGVIGYAAYRVAEWLASILVAIEVTAAVVAVGAVTAPGGQSRRRPSSTITCTCTRPQPRNPLLWRRTSDHDHRRRRHRLCRVPPRRRPATRLYQICLWIMEQT